MRTSTRMTLAAGWATALGAVPLGAVYDTWRWVWFTWAAIAAVVIAHLLARSLRLPAGLVPLVGAIGLLEYLVIVFAGDRAFLGLLPTGAAMRALRDGVQSGFVDVRELSAPVPATAGLELLTAGSVGLVAIAVDLVAVVLRRPAAAGLALLALYAVPTAVALDGVAWPLFVIAAIGYLVLLMAEGRERLLHWGRPVSSGGAPDDAGEEAPPPLTGQRIGAAALAAAVIVPLFVPGLTTNALSKLGRTGVGDGTGSGSGALSPFAALKGQLLQPEPKELFRIQTTDADLWYVRLKVLERYTGSGWVESSRGVDRPVTGELSPPLGQQTRLLDQPYDATVTVTGNFRDDALPTFFWPRHVGVPAEWGYNSRKAVVVARSQRRGEITYRIDGYEPRPTPEELSTASEVPAEDPVMLTLGTRPNVPRLVHQTVDDVVDGRSGPYQRALALNDYFTDRTNGNGFTYSTTTKTGDSGNALVDFLTKKQGYCEQYAAAMAVMLRLTGIPSRVVLGYTHHTRSTDGVWSIQTNDAHAWVEAYFGSDIGWVPFDPTPLVDGRSVGLPWAPHRTATTSPSTPVSGSSGSAVSGSFPSGRRDPNDIDPTGSGGSSQPGLFTPKAALGSLGLLALIGLLLSPGVGRVLVRRRRLQTAGSADALAAARTAWDEVLASAEDYGVAIPDTETPRRTAARLAGELSLDPPAVAGLQLAALAEERARYAPVAGVEGDLPAAVRAVRRGFRGVLPGSRRWRAALLPRSALRAARTGAAQRAEQASLALNRLIDGPRRALTPRRPVARDARPES
jgi:transglutaminase-like putative cysteine protease